MRLYTFAYNPNSSKYYVVWNVKKIIQEMVYLIISYEARTLLEWSMFRCRTRYTYNYIELCDFLKLYWRVSVRAVSGIRVHTRAS